MCGRFGSEEERVQHSYCRAAPGQFGTDGTLVEGLDAF